MKIKDTLQRSWKNIGRAKLRVGLTAASLAIGGATMTMALALTQGAQDMVAKEFGDLTNNYVYVNKNPSKTEGEREGLRTLESANKRPTTQDLENQLVRQADLDKLRKIEGVTKVTPVNDFAFYGVEIAGIKYQNPYVQNFDITTQRPELVAGSFDDLKDNGIVVSENFAKQAGYNSVADFLGKKVTFLHKGELNYATFRYAPDTRVEFTVVGIISSKDSYSELAYAPTERLTELDVAAQRSKAPSKPITYAGVILTTEVDKTEQIKSDLKAQGYGATTKKDRLDSIMTGVSAIRLILLIFAGIAIFAAVFGVINTQLMSVLERTREIGLMKALGMSRRNVLLMFTVEAGWIGFIGSIIGTLIAIPFSMFIGSQSESFKAPITFTNFLIVVVSLIAIAMLAGYLPAKRAAKLDPVEALRSE